ncbi:MAG TPA: RNA polymerase sigma factor SigJ [Pilimelia sp.]|nr:RNA polymerase sigma factor SigJ [Pilimelia sp.]
MRDLASEFAAERDHLTSVAYRMLGSRADAEDAVQDAWLRCSAALGDPEARARIRDLRAWLTTTVGRICLDMLRSARVRREAYVGQWLPEPVVSRLAGTGAVATVAGPVAPGIAGAAGGFAPDPAERAALREDLGLALLVVLERLTPEQRVAFVLHDVFAVPFEEIAEVLGATPAAARQLASRARRAVADGGPRHTADLAEQRRVLAAFLAATESGDIERLVAVLAPDVVMIGDGGGLAPAARRPVSGAIQVARFVLGLLRRAQKETEVLGAELVLVNGALGFLVEGDYRGDQRLRMVIAFAIDSGRITGIFDQVNPTKLARVAALDSNAVWPPL